ncbi:MAG: ATP-binding protein [candidate division Zixibacteria bacterium]|nr:ATP-binding protein [candidate division Zixibacteria bacterium]
MAPLPKRTSFILFVDFLLFVLSVCGVHRATQRANVPAVFAGQNGPVVVKSVSSTTGETGLRPKDTVLSVNGQPVATPRDIEFVLDGLPISDTASFSVRRGSSVETVFSRLKPFYAREYFAIQLSVGSLFFILGLLVLVKRPGDEAAHVFHWASVAVALLIMITSNRYPGKLPFVSRILDITYCSAGAFAPALFLHFSFIFPRPKWEKARKLLPYMYLLAAGLAAGTIFTLFRANLPVSVEQFHRFVQAYAASRIFFIACIAFSLVSLVHSYRTAPEESERRKLRWVMLGLNLGPPIFVAWQLPILLGTSRWVREEYMHIALSLVPITFAISIIRYRLMNIDPIFRRSTIYTIVLVVLLALYALIVGAAARITETFSLISVLAPSGAAFLVALLFEPVRRVVQRFVDRSFFRVQFDFRQAERRFVDEIKRSVNIPELADMILFRLEEILPVLRLGFFSLEKPGPRLHLLAHRNLERLQTHGIHLDPERLKALSALPLALEEHLEPGAAFEQVEPETLGRWGIALVFPVLSKDSELLGFLALGPKKSGTRFSLEEVELLTTVATQAGLAMERINLQQKLLLEQAEARRLEELNRLKSYFVSSVSHDLKTPLTSIKMFAEILRSKKGLAPAESEEYLEIIEGESERLARLINNVLDFARVEQGVKEYHFTEFDVNEGVERVLRALAYQFKMEGCGLETRLSLERLVVPADPDAFFEAVENLLSNALKYSLEEKKVTVSTFRSDRRAAVRVEDCGIGISAEDLPHIFEPFFRGKNERAQEAGGAGLGLALVKHMVELHGGKIEVESAPGRGSTFTLFFPLEEMDETNPDR